MADDIEDEQSGEEQKEEEALPERLKKIFINHVDSFHGKHIARVSPISREKQHVGWPAFGLKIFARSKPGSTNDAVEEEEAVEEEHAEERRKQLYDEYPVDDGWKVSGTVQDNQNYKRPPFIQETIQVRRNFLRRSFSCYASSSL